MKQNNLTTNIKMTYKKPAIEIIELESQGILCLSIQGIGISGKEEYVWEDAEETDNPNNIW